MGSGASRDPDVQAKAVTAKIDKEIDVASKKQSRECKLLLLGSADCGKSTIFKQMKIIHLSGFDTEETLSFVPALRANVLQGVASMVQFCDEQQLQIHPSLQSVADTHRAGALELTPTIAANIIRLMQDPAMEQALLRSGEYGLFDQMSYFLQRATSFADPNFLPNIEDLLRVRVRTTGVREIQFENSAGKPFRLVDVGGQRSERRKWISQFDNVNALFYVTSLADFNRPLKEDPTKNALRESLELFTEIVNSEYFCQTNCILFLNKQDIFQKTLPSGNLSLCFKTYKGGSDYQSAVMFIHQRFLNAVKSVPVGPDKLPRRVYPHITTATSTANISHVFNTAQDMILRSWLGMGGIL